MLKPFNDEEQSWADPILGGMSPDEWLAIFRDVPRGRAFMGKWGDK